MIWLKVAVDGRTEPLNFLLDSGAGASVVDLSSARRIGLKLGERQAALGVDGRAVAYRVNGFSAHVQGAGVSLGSSPLALDLSGPSRFCSRHIDGLIGMDFFREHIVRIDFSTQTICLLRRDELILAGCEIVPLAGRNDTLCARISVDGNAPEWLRLDTGCDGALEWVVTGGKARKFGITTVGLNSASVRDIQTEVQWGTLHLHAIKTGLHPRPMFAGEAGLIGNGMLSRFVVTIDAAQRRCLLANR
ncbi:MAG TPA: retropepsin-like aspartic protease [Chthoniobacter sp.]